MAMILKRISSAAMPGSLTSGPIAIFMLAALIGALFLPPSAFAQSGEDLASINGRVISEAELELTETLMGRTLARIPPERRREIAMRALIDAHLLGQAARELNIEKGDKYKVRIEALGLRLLQDLYVSDVLSAEISDMVIQNSYEQRFADFKPAGEMRARHILVADEGEAKTLIKALDEGEDFADMARQHSTGPSGPNGGDLGYFQEGQMVAEFAKAASLLKVGVHSAAPVKTQFGWHIIKLEDRRETAPPPLAQIREEIRRELLGELIRSKLSELRGGAKIEIFDETLQGAAINPDG